MLRRFLLTAVTASMVWSGVFAQSFDIAFDGSCDGLQLEVGPDLMIGGVHTGCVSGVVAGNVAVDLLAYPFDEQAGFGVNIRPVRPPGVTPVAHTLLDFVQQRFGVYLTLDGEPPFLWRSGTFHFGTPTASATSAPPSTMPGDEGSEPDSSGALPIDITFDGLCDGIRFSIGPTATVGGHHTGCESGLVAGNLTINFTSVPFERQAGSGLTLGTFPDGTGASITLINFAERTWAHYQSLAGEPPVVVNSGTFSFAAPGPTQAGLPSSRWPR